MNQMANLQKANGFYDDVRDGVTSVAMALGSAWRWEDDAEELLYRLQGPLGVLSEIRTVLRPLLSQKRAGLRSGAYAYASTGDVSDMLDRIENADIRELGRIADATLTAINVALRQALEAHDRLDDLQRTSRFAFGARRRTKTSAINAVAAEMATCDLVLQTLEAIDRRVAEIIKELERSIGS